MSDFKFDLSRRQLLGTGAVLGGASLLNPSIAFSQEKPSEKFSGLRPLHPAPQQSSQKGADPDLIFRHGAE